MINLKLKQKVLLPIFFVILTINICSVIYFAYYLDSNFKMQEDKRIENSGNFINTSLAIALWNFNETLIKRLNSNVHSWGS